MKISTRQYAKRQISWIRNKLIPAVNVANAKENLVPLYLMDATGSQHRSYYACLSFFFWVFPSVLGEDWLQNVQTPAMDILESESTIFLVYLILKILQDSYCSKISLTQSFYRRLHPECWPLPPGTSGWFILLNKLILFLYIPLSDQPLCWRRGERRYVHFVRYRRIVQWW